MKRSPAETLDALIGDGQITRTIALKAMDIYGQQCYEDKSVISYRKYKKSLGKDAVCVCEHPVMRLKAPVTCNRCGRPVVNDIVKEYEDRIKP